MSNICGENFNSIRLTMPEKWGRKVRLLHKKLFLEKLDRTEKFYCFYVKNITFFYFFQNFNGISTSKNVSNRQRTLQNMCSDEKKKIEKILIFTFGKGGRYP